MFGGYFTKLFGFEGYLWYGVEEYGGVLRGIRQEIQITKRSTLIRDAQFCPSLNSVDRLVQ